MSGISGIINFDGAPVDLDILSKMAVAAAHRGPDGIDYWHNGQAGLTHLALKITPESLREQQPLVSQQDDLVLTADARIDNRDELIQVLLAKGDLTVADPTDAELILSAYRCWGTDCPSHLIGDFAFAIWDRSRQHLFAARDPMAMRAFYYRVESQRLLFATEVKQILAVPGVPARIFEPAVGAYLSDSYGHLDWSFYEGITQLPPAHALLVNASGPRTWRYWDIDPDYRIEYANEDDYAEHFLEIFKEAVRCRLRSVKPVGLLLSGGMDSGSIASTAGWLAQQNGRPYPPLHPYCWAFEALPQCDERHISNGIVSHYGFAATDVPADDAWPLKDYPAHGPDQDEPFIGQYQGLIEHALAMAQSEGMGLMMSGDRGDLMVGDWLYDYPGLLKAGQWQTLWHELQAHSQLVGVPLRRVTKKYLLSPLLRSFWPQGKAEGLRRPLRQIYRMLQHSQPRYPDWVQPEFAKKVGLADIIDQDDLQLKGDFARCQRYQRVFAVQHMKGMVWSERSQARFGLGFADPWSDRRLASFVLAVPQHVICRAGENKRLARQAMRGIMPEPVRQTASKIYPLPFYEHAIKGKSHATVQELLTNSRAADCGYINGQVLRSQYQSLCSDGTADYRLWMALTLEMWLRQYWS